MRRGELSGGIAKAAKKRANGIFTTMSVAHVDDDDDEIRNPGEVYHVERIFPNEDIYTGQWADTSPSGHGKYLWADGCMYVGGWLNGRPNGKGRFSWPSGATYEGQFKNGYMDGEGTYTGSTDDTYRGTWSSNMRHGKGIQNYDNGDYYEGRWKQGLPDGKGRYHWGGSGHEYDGQWRCGMMNGVGTMIWANGNQYDGSWRDGLPRGKGTFRWADGSFYIGVWSEDPREQSGTYYPSSPRVGSLDWDPQEMYLVNLNDCRISPGEKIPVFPSEKTVNWTCDEDESLHKAGLKRENERRLRRASVGRLSNYNGHSMGSESDLSVEGAASNEGLSSAGGGGAGAQDLDSSRGYRKPRLVIKPARKQGHPISKGHKHYELMLNLQLGIR